MSALKEQVSVLQAKLSESQSATNSNIQTTTTAGAGDNKLIDSLKEDNEVAQGQVSWGLMIGKMVYS